WNGIEHAPGVDDGQRLRHRFRQLRRAHRGKRGVAHQAAAIEEPEEAAQHRERARRRAALQLFRGALREVCPEIRRGQRGKLGKARHLAAMLAEEIEELGEIEAVAGEGVRRDTPLGGKPILPLRDGGGEIGRGGVAGERQRLRPARSASYAAGRSSHAAMVMPSARARKPNSSVPWPPWNLPGRRMPMQRRPAGAAELTERRSIAAERTRPAPSPNSIGSPSTSLCSTTSRSAPSTLSTVPGSRICTP